MSLKFGQCGIEAEGMVDLIVSVALLLVSAAAQAAGPSWPGMWGPSRNGIAEASGAPTRPAALQELWRRPTQDGYSQVAVDARGGVTMEVAGGIDYVLSLEAATGRQQWRSAVGPTYRGHGARRDGAIATPALDGNDVFVVAPHGVLVALDRGTGKERWRHDLVKEFGATTPGFGFGTSPLIEGNLVVVQTSGEKSRGLLAFDRAGGKLAWTARHGIHGGYASPTAGTLGGTRQIIASAGDAVFAVSPADGGLLWTVKGLGGDPETVAHPPQLLPNDRVLVTSWNDAALIKVSGADGSVTAAEVWRSPLFRAAHSPTIYRDGHLYGFAGPVLICADATTGEIKWRERFPTASISAAGNHLFILARTTGDLHIVEASPRQFTEVGRTRVLKPESLSVTAPSIAGRRIFIRNFEEIVAYSIEER